MKPMHGPHGAHGFSLIEILIAMAILMFGLNATAYFSRTVTQAEALAEQQSMAVHLTRSRLEQMRLFRDKAHYDTLATGGDITTGSSASYAMAWTVTTHASPLYKTVTMRTSWLDGRGITQSVTLDSVIAWFDPQENGRILQ